MTVALIPPLAAVAVTAPADIDPLEIAYETDFACAYALAAALYNEAGFPASPFRD